jgi:DNA-binding IscR family transcriptional regulator
MSDSDIVLKYLNEFKERRGDKCGSTIVSITQATNIEIEQLKTILNRLFKDKIIIIRKGINGKLIFLR